MQMNDDRLEAELRNALRPEQPPEGFAERVLARARREPAAPGVWQRLFGFVRVPRFRFAVATAMVLVIIAGSWQYRRHEREREAREAARQQLMLALQITENKLHFVQQKLDEAGARQYGTAIDSEDSQ